MQNENDNNNFNAFFLGPKSENGNWLRTEMQETLDQWFQWRKDLFPEDPQAISKSQRLGVDYLTQREKLSQNLSDLNDRLRNEVPKYTPRYLGHMVSENSIPAILGHMAALIHNPNNTSKEAARVTLPIEKEAIEMLADMVGYDPDKAQGHFTSGGTVANFESIWRARFRMDHWISLALYISEERGQPFNLMDAAHMGWDRYFELLKQFSVNEDDTRYYSPVGGNPFLVASLISKDLGAPYAGPVVLIPGNKHFSWIKGVNIFGLGESAFWTIPLDHAGKLDCSALEKLIEKAKTQNRPILMVVSVAGTTESGTIDPVHRVQDILDRYEQEQGISIWHHVDAAYGGFICSMIGKKDGETLTKDNEQALMALSRAHSVTIDPHKLGYIPYSCGAFLCRDSEAYTVSTFSAPYLDRKDLGSDVWSSTIEGSRSASGATATWLTGKVIGYGLDGFGNLLGSTFDAKKSFCDFAEKELPFLRLLKPIDTNVVCFSLAGDGDTLEAANYKTLKVFEKFTQSATFSVSKTTLSTGWHDQLIGKHVESYNGDKNSSDLILIRCIFMNPFWSIKDVRTKLRREFIEEIKSYYCQFDGG